ncbi:MAG: hypothetical protein C0399_06770 [Syntrophus sp. (in: bacteria)]|nr:hypothetical protein [Syntrophus sp. (in: bacteria)]
MSIIAPSPDTSTKKRYALRGGGHRQGSPTGAAAEAQSRANRPYESTPSVVNVETDGSRLLKSHIWKSIDTQPFIHPQLIVYPGMTEIKRPVSCLRGSKHESNAKRGKITRFSRKSRVAMKKFQCKIATPWQFRFELTYPDDTMEERTIEERALKFSHDINLLKKYIERHYPGMWVLWKKEYESRKTGTLKDQYCPHGHFVVQCPEWLSDDARYYSVFYDIGNHWIKITGTKRDKMKAIAVLFNRNSYGYLAGDGYNAYMSKWSSYISKEASEIVGENSSSIGRVWGHMGKIELSPGEEIDITDHQILLTQRTLRRYLRSTQRRTKKLSDGTKIRVKPKYPYEKRLRDKWFNGFVIIKDETVHRILGAIIESSG